MKEVAFWIFWISVLVVKCQPNTSATTFNTRFAR